MTAPHNYYTGSETPPNYTTDQAMYYPLTYYTTGYETPAIYTDQSNYFSLDGPNPNPHYSAESGPYAYYVPGYGYMYPSSDQYSNPYQSYQPYQSQSPLAPTPAGYVQFFVQPDSQPLALTSPGQPSAIVPAGTGTNNARLGNHNNNNNNSGTKNRANASTSATVSLSPVSLVTGASRSSHHGQITTKPSENQGQNANSAVQNALTEQNKGPRTGKSNGTTSKSKSNPDSYPSDAIKLSAELYTGVDFSVDRPNGKFFVIKSYSEDDVHKSIKYNVWSSTPNGNRRLNAAYLAAQDVATADPEGCPVFLFFSVNASGQFCGVAEMIGPVDFNKHVDVWQQDKWQGSFPVKWHIIKDVLNASFRHITLENNENKPVTNSRDTQEVPYKAGVNMLKIFKNTPLTSSVLEDFPFYEARQLAMIQDKCRRLGRVYDSSLFVPAIVVKTGSVADRSIESQSSNKDLGVESNGGELSEPEVESEEKRELELEERTTELEVELGEKLELEDETESQAEIEEKTAEAGAKAELQVELKEGREIEAESQVELKEETEAESQVESKEKTEIGAEMKEKTDSELKGETESEKMEPKEKIELESSDLVEEGSCQN